MPTFYEERAFYEQSFFGATFDFRSRISFSRFDACVFVDCKILVDAGTEQLSFTNCVFESCDLDGLAPDEARALIFHDNTFQRSAAERKADFELRLAKTIAKRIAHARSA